MTNPFDRLAGVPDTGDDLSGIGSKLKKAVKKIGQIPKKIVAEVKRSPIAKAALVIGAGVLLAPVAATAFKAVSAKVVGGSALKAGASTAVKAASAASKASTASKVFKTVKSVAKTAIKHAPAASAVLGTGIAVAAGMQQIKASKVATKLARDASADPEVKAAIKNRRTPKVAKNIANRIVEKTPEFEAMVNTLKAEGKSDEEISKIWAGSKSFVDTSQAAVAGGLESDIVKQLMSQGYPQQTAQSYAPAIAQDMGRDAGQQIQNEMGGINTTHLMIGGGILAGVYLLSQSKSKRGR